MSNQFLPNRFVEIIDDLAIGIEPTDAMRGGRIPPPLHVVRDVPLTDAARVQLGDERRFVTSAYRRMRRSPTCRFHLLYSQATFDGADPFVRMRLVQGFNAFAPRHYVPRRLEVPLQDPTTADLMPAQRRIHRPALFPGADYPIHDCATGVRGRVERAGVAVPWTRIEARRVADARVVGRAHGDDRGEFLLLLDPHSAAPGGAQMWVTVRVYVYVRDPVLVPPPVLEQAIDPMWDLPLEQLPLTAAPSDAVSRGEQLPANYALRISRDVTLRVGETFSDLDPYNIP